jgi:hypothetical protein
MLNAADPVKLLAPPPDDDWPEPAPTQANDIPQIEIGAFVHSFSEFEDAPAWAGGIAATPPPARPVVDLEPVASFGFESLEAVADPEAALVPDLDVALVPAAQSEQVAPSTADEPVFEHPAAVIARPIFALAELASDPEPEPAPVQRGRLAPEPEHDAEPIHLAFEAVRVEDERPLAPEPAFAQRRMALEPVHSDGERHVALDPMAAAVEMPEEPPVPRGLVVIAGRPRERDRHVGALERLLRKVEARRLQIAHGSVA